MCAASARYTWGRTEPKYGRCERSSVNRKLFLVDHCRRITMRLLLIALALLTYSASDRAMAGARQEAKVLMPSDSAALKIEQDWGFADAIVTGDTIYFSGVVAGVREGDTDLQLGYTRAFGRIGDILKNAGATWDEVVEITSFHTDLKTRSLVDRVASRPECRGTNGPAIGE